MKKLKETIEKLDNILDGSCTGAMSTLEDAHGLLTDYLTERQAVANYLADFSASISEGLIAIGQPGLALEIHNLKNDILLGKHLE